MLLSLAPLFLLAMFEGLPVLGKGAGDLPVEKRGRASYWIVNDNGITGRATAVI